MREDWNNDTLDDILADVQRMTREREEAQEMAQAHPQALHWSMQDVDALLGMQDDLLAGISDYALPQTDTPPENAADGQTKVMPAITDAPVRAKNDTPPENAADGQTKVMPAITDAPVRAKNDTPPEYAADGQTKVMPAVTDAPVRAKNDTPPEYAADGQTKVMPAVTDAPVRAKTGESKPRATSAPAPKRPQPEVDGQIMLQGFATDEQAQPLDEEEAAQALNERRAEQVKDFKLYDFAQKYEPDLPSETDIFEPEPEPSAEPDDRSEEKEYRRFSDRMQIGRFLQENRRAAFFSVCGLLLIEIVLIIVSVIAGRLDGAERSVLYAANLILTAGATALSISSLLRGARDLIRLQPSCDSAALVTVAATLAHSVVALMLPGADGIPGMFGAAAVLLLLLNKGAKLFESLAILSNFKFCAFTAAEHLHTVRGVDTQEDLFEIAQNLAVDNPKLRYAGKTRFPADFLKNSDFRSAVDRLCKFILPAAFGAAVIAAVAGWLRTGFALSALTAFTGTVCIAMPAGAAFTVSIPVAILMQRLNRRGGMIVSPAAASANTGVTAVAMEATDLYDSEQCSIDCYQEFYSIRFDDMFLYAASLVIGVHGPLESAFMEIVGNTDILPPAKNIVCEERLGISAYIRGQSVLLGNRNLLTAHSVEAPAKSVEIPYLQEGKRILYLAVGNKVTTMFVVNYIENDALAKPLQVLHSNETGLVVYTADCNLTEEFLCEGFDLPQGSVKSMSSKAGEILRARCAEKTDSAPAQLMTGGRAESLLYTLADAAVIHNIQRVAAFVGILACGIGWLVTFVLMLLTEIHVVNWALATLYTLLWTAVSTALGVIQANKMQ